MRRWQGPLCVEEKEGVDGKVRCGVEEYEEEGVDGKVRCALRSTRRKALMARFVVA